MNISVKTKYGVSAVLALALQYEKGPIQIRQISSQCDIPHQFLEQIMSDLKKKQIVTSFRGSKGGYTLSKHPDKVTVRDIILALDGPSQIAERQCGCHALTEFWGAVETQYLDALNVTLSTLVTRSRELNEHLTYTI